MRNTYQFLVLFTLLKILFATINNDSYKQNIAQVSENNSSLKVLIRMDIFEKLQLEFFKDQLPQIIRSIQPFDYHAYGDIFFLLQNIKQEKYKYNEILSKIIEKSEGKFQIQIRDFEIQIYANVTLNWMFFHIVNNVRTVFKCDLINIDFSFIYNDLYERTIQVNDVQIEGMFVEHIWAHDCPEFTDFLRKLRQDTINDGFTNDFQKILKKSVKYELNQLIQQQDISFDTNNQIFIDRKLSNDPYTGDQGVIFELNMRVFQSTVEQKYPKQVVLLPNSTKTNNQIDIMISQNFFNDILYTYQKLGLLNLQFNSTYLQNEINLTTNLFKSSLPALIFKYGLDTPMQMNITILNEPNLNITTEGINFKQEINIDFQIIQKEIINNTTQFNLITAFSVQSEINLKVIATLNQNILQLEIIAIDSKNLKNIKGQIKVSTLFEISGEQIIRQLLKVIVLKLNKDYLSSILDIQQYIITKYYNITNSNIFYSENYFVVGGDIQQSSSSQNNTISSNIEDLNTHIVEFKTQIQ